MRQYLLLPVLVLSYFIIIFPFSFYMKNRPLLEKLGYTPEPGVLKLLSIDQNRFVAATLLMKVINYYGGIHEGTPNKVQLPPEYAEMERAIKTAVQLDPYNMDAYYFAQAIMVWDAKQVTATNELLEFGMRYRKWDYYLPFFAGFNYAYFLKDYSNAAKYYERVGELTGNAISMTLAGRYLYEAGRTNLAIDYLSLMVKSAGNEAVRKTLQTRLQAFLGVREIEQSARTFQTKVHRPPRSVEELYAKGYLSEIPIDPYGGTFYIDKEGKVRSTSKFAFGVAKMQ